MEPLLAGLVGEAVAVAETDSSQPDPESLWPEERPLVAKAVPSRVRDFSLGRRCARAAMADLGAEPAAILRGPDREPRWPAGLVGSITHTAGYVGAAVAKRSDRLAIGIDAEPNEPLEAGVVDRIARPEERDRLDGETGSSISVERLLFCAKEAIYKVWFPVAGCWLGYHDASVEFDLTSQTFEATILIDGPIDVVSGRFGVAGGIIATAIELPAR